MSEIFKRGQRVRAEGAGVPCEVEEFLGGGGQGEVYKAKLGGRLVALKWYYPDSATPEQRRALETLIKKGPPTDRFLWPQDLASSGDVSGFGYIMPLREARYRSIVDLMKRRVEPTIRVLSTAGLNLANSFMALHTKGLCYRDVSFGNVFFDPATGDVLICDNDNVSVHRQSTGGVLGTPRFMAPEVVRMDAKPDADTDLFSLAVLLFYMFMFHHPLEGRKELAIRCLDLPAMRRLYGDEPVFIFDPKDKSNEPVPGTHDNAIATWKIYPQFLRDLFTKSFTDGIRDPKDGRVRAGEWRAAMVKLRDSIVYCGRCGSENFYDPDRLKASSSPGECWNCGTGIRLPPRIRIGSSVAMLNADTVLHPHHVDPSRLYDFTVPIASVNPHPKDPKVWGLKNLGREKWVAITTAGAILEIGPGQSVTISDGTRVNFGRVEGEIRS